MATQMVVVAVVAVMVVVKSQDRSVHLLMVGSELGHHVRDVLGDNLGE